VAVRVGREVVLLDLRADRHHLAVELGAASLHEFSAGGALDLVARQRDFVGRVLPDAGDVGDDGATSQHSCRRENDRVLVGQAVALAVSAGDEAGVRDGPAERLGVADVLWMPAEHLGHLLGHPVEIAVDVVGLANEEHLLCAPDGEDGDDDGPALPNGRLDALDKSLFEGRAVSVFDVAVGALGEDCIDVGAGSRAGDQPLSTDRRTAAIRAARGRIALTVIVGVEVAGVEQACLPVVHEDVRTAGDVARVEEGDFVASSLEGLAVAVRLRDLGNPPDLRLGEGTPRRIAVKFQGVAGERQREFARRGCPVHRRAGVAGEQRRHRPRVVEVAVADHHRIRGHLADRVLRRVLGLDPVIEQQRVVDQNRAPADLTRAAEKLEFHLLGYQQSGRKGQKRRETGRRIRRVAVHTVPEPAHTTCWGGALCGRGLYVLVMSDSVLIYDGECPYCSIAAVALKRLDDVVAVSWYDDPVEEFLDAQFGERPFAMILVDPDEGRVYAGRSAVEELADRAGTPGIVGSLVRDNYERIASAVGTLSGRGRDPADFHDTYPLEEAAAGFLPALRAAGEADAAVVEENVEDSQANPGAGD